MGLCWSDLHNSWTRLFQYRAHRKYVSATNKRNLWHTGGDAPSIVHFAFLALIKNSLTFIIIIIIIIITTPSSPSPPSPGASGYAMYCTLLWYLWYRAKDDWRECRPTLRVQKMRTLLYSGISIIWFVAITSSFNRKKFDLGSNLVTWNFVVFSVGRFVSITLLRWSELLGFLVIETSIKFQMHV
jgi:hypothetical protein